MGTIEGAAVASVMEWDHPSVWSIKWDMRLLSTIYTVRLSIQPNYRTYNKKNIHKNLIL